MKTIEERFWDKVDKSGECWIWTASVRGPGYGQCTIGHKKQGYAHRYSYTLAYGPIPDGHEIDHTCHVRLCVNPDHLRAVTRKQNMENVAGAYRNSASGIRGVWWVERLRRWHAVVRHNNQILHVGWYATADEAEVAAIAMRNELFTHNDADRIAT